MKPEETSKLLHDAAKDEVKLTRAAIEIAIAKYTGQWQGQLRNAVYAAAVPIWFDAQLLGRLLGGISLKKAQKLYSTISSFSFIENYTGRDACGIHERTRLPLLRWMKREHVERYQQLSRRAEWYFGGISRTGAQIDWIYHALAADPESGCGLLARIYENFKRQEKVEHLQTLAARVGEHLQENRLSGRARALVLEITAIIGSRYRPLALTEADFNESLRLYQALRDERAEVALLGQIGDIQIRQKKWDEAFGSFQSALAIQKKLARQSRQGIESLRELCILYDQAGDVKNLQLKLDEAQGSYEESFAIRKQLAIDNPENNDRLHDLSISFDKLGQIARARGELGKAYELFDSSLNLRKKLAASQPIERQNDLYLAYNNYGNVQYERGELEDAVSAYSTAVSIGRDLTAQDRKNPRNLYNLSRSHNRLGIALLSLGRVEAARFSFQTAIAIMERLTALDPQNVGFRYYLRISRYYISQASKHRPSPPNDC